MSTKEAASLQGLQYLHNLDGHVFIKPVKKINEGQDVQTFLTTKGYGDIAKFLLQLNAAMFPRRIPNSEDQVWDLGSANIRSSVPVEKLCHLIMKLDQVIEEAPPDPGPRRFGNISFRKWYSIVAQRVDELFRDIVPATILNAGQQGEERVTAWDEIRAYLLGSFGSAPRLDYGTGHELNFMALLGSLWKLGYFDATDPSNEARAVVLRVIDGYLRLIRRLVLTYNLEPAGSHGVWGLDDHAFIPYIFGSAQLGPAIADGAAPPTEGSRNDAPEPADVTKLNVVERERIKNLYFGAIGFIYDVKKGPFWEHSPILYDISGIRDGWGKVNKGMLKMYNAEVLSKFPVVQHFLFGSLYSWDQDPEARPVAMTKHVAEQSGRPKAPSTAQSQGRGALRMRNTIGIEAPSQSSTRVPQAAMPSQPDAVTRAPWASTSTPNMPPTTRAPWAKDP